MKLYLSGSLLREYFLWVVVSMSPVSQWCINKQPLKLTNVLDVNAMISCYIQTVLKC